MARNWTLLKKGDVVTVTSGKEVGKSGKILKMLPKKHRVIVEKINMVKRHTKPSAQVRQGGIIEREGGIDVSNLMIVCNKCNAPVRIGKHVLEDGTKVRMCRKCGEILDK
jgi:large subunit ribosomal protein L24